ncbi:MAG: nucleotidyltransferase family protein [Pseudomonadales bacterium]
MNGVSAILLAAGESRRMGKLNKLTLQIHGEALVRRSARLLLAADLTEVVVVSGYRADTTKELLADLPLRLVCNKAFRDGQMISVHCGLNALSRPCDAVMVCLSDMPLLQIQDLRFLIDAFYRTLCRRPRGLILVPSWQGQRGNPILFEFQYAAEILKNAPNLGCKGLLKNKSESITELPMQNNHVLVDMDSFEDYSRFYPEEAMAYA